VYKTRQDGAYFADFRKDSGTGYFAFGNNSNNAIYSQGGTLYVNGVTGTTVPLNAWTHICVTGMTIESSTIKIACQNNDTNCFQGSYSSFSVYSGTKSAEEVYALYSKGITYNESAESSLLHYYRMGDDTSKAYPTIADSSSNSNDGTITNGASDDIVQQMVAGYDMGAFESTGEELGDSDWNGSVITYEANGYQFFSGISNNTLYKVQYTIATRTAGGLSFAGGSSAFGSLTLADSIGTHTYYFLSVNTTIQLRSTGFRGTITDYSAKPILQSADLSDTYPAIIDVNEPVLGVELITSNTTSDWATYGGNLEDDITDGSGVYITVPSSGGDSRGSYYYISGLTSGKIYKAVFQAYTSIRS
jgi:hypothetical protein